VTVAIHLIASQEGSALLKSNTTQPLLDTVAQSDTVQRHNAGHELGV